jgi:dihydrofolate reductase
MGGGTRFHFVTDGIRAALQRTTDAANGRDIRLGGHVTTIRQYLRTGLVDKLHLAFPRSFLVRGSTFCRYRRSQSRIPVRRTYLPKAMHIVLTKRRRWKAL